MQSSAKAPILQFAAIIIFALLSFKSVANPTRPLLIPGKKDLYQRVLSLPDAKLFPRKELSQKDHIELAPFTVYYVYQRFQENEKTEWLQVGGNRIGQLDGWIRADHTLEWNQGLTLMFHNPVEHDRVLLYSDKESIQTIVDNYDIRRYKKFYRAATQGKQLKNSPVVAIQPPENIDITKNFYLLPIYDYEDIYLDGQIAKLLKVSSISIRESSSLEKPTDTNKKQPDYTAGIAFTIDATLSMQPYINRTRQAAKKIYQRLDQSNLLGQVRFGLVAFRDNIKAAFGVGFLTRQLVSLEQGANPNIFLRKINRLAAAIYPTRDFVEDSYAGVEKTLSAMNWSSDAARYIILITDAGPREATDPLSATKLDAVQLNQMAQDKGVAIFVLHLLSPSGQANSKEAAAKYRQLSNYPGIGSLYYPVTAANLEEFGQVIDSLAGQITSQITAIGEKSEASLTQEETTNPKLAALREKTAKLGHALRLNYLRKTKNQTAPGVFNAWLLDKDFLNPENKSVDVCVLLTRDQLSDLYDVLRQVLETAEQGLISPKNFIGDLKIIAATISRDPAKLGTTTNQEEGNSLADIGFLREYIEDLPYTGQVMNLALDDWHSWSTTQQVNFLSQLEEKITYYRALHDHTDIWISLDNKPINGNSVFPVPLDMLP